MYERFIGIDYSGQGTPPTRTAGLQVYAASGNELPERLAPISSATGRSRNWCRREMAEWLIDQAATGKRFIAGLDVSFSLPLSYFERYGLTSWDVFLTDFVEHWPTDQDGISVDRSPEARHSVFWALFSGRSEG